MREFHMTVFHSLVCRTKESHTLAFRMKACHSLGFRKLEYHMMGKDMYTLLVWSNFQE